MTRRRPLAAAAATVLTLLLTAPLLGVSSPGHARTEERGARSPDRPFVGYAIPRTRQAGSGWIGARRLRDGGVVYRTDPARLGTTARYGPPVETANFISGGRRVGPSRTACAAYLLDDFGVPARGQDPEESRQQAAAVDIAVQHLLYGRGYRYDRPRQRARTDQRSNGPLLRAYAEKLVADYCPLAGPYRVALGASATTVDAGQPLEFSVEVRSRSGAPVARALPTLTVGSERLQARTSAAGTASFALIAREAGPLVADLTVGELAPTTVRYRVPSRQGASRVVRAGIELRSAYPRSRTVAVVGQPTLQVFRRTPVARRESFDLRFKLAATYPGRRVARVAVYGPLPAAEPTPPPGPDPRCRPGLRVRRLAVTVVDDGTYRTPRTNLTRRGDYVWEVSVPGDTYNKPVTRCGGMFRVG